MEENTRRILLGVVLVALAMPVFHVAQPVAFEESHEYQVKVEQVEQGSQVNDSVVYDNLSEDEREMLFRAFKKNDHFLCSSSTHTRTEEKLNVETNEWKVVRVNGVPILMAILYAGSQKVPSGTTAAQAAFVAATMSLVVGAIGILILIHVGFWRLAEARRGQRGR